MTRWCRNDKTTELGIKMMTLDTWNWIINSHRIYCLTPHPDSLLMWAHYGDKHKGVCLEFDSTLHFGRAYRVKYADNLPLISPENSTDGHALIGPMFCTVSILIAYVFESLGRFEDALSTARDILAIYPGFERAEELVSDIRKRRTGKRSRLGTTRHWASWRKLRLPVKF